MIKILTRNPAVLIALLIFYASGEAFGQPYPSPEILQWESEIARFDSLNLVEDSDAGTLLVTGSSSVRLWDSIHADMAPYKVMQRGYGGAKLTDFNYYEDRIIKAQQFKAIVIFVANDIAGAESDKTPKELRQLFRDLVRQLRLKNPDTPICWVETTPTPSRWHVTPQVREANGLIAKYCERNKDLHFIHTFDYFITPQGIPDSTFFRQDMLHLNRQGYKQWSEIIRTSLADAGIEP